MKALVIALLMGLTLSLFAQQVEPWQETGSSTNDVLLIYNEEANLFFSKREYATALENYQKVISFLRDNQLSDPSILLQAMCGKMFCYDMLNQEPFAKAAFEELVDEVAALNERVEEIDWFKQSRVYPEFQQNPNRYALKIEKVGLLDDTPEENCQLQCNGYAVAAAYACGKVPNPAIQFVCYGCIFGLEQLCVRCCRGAGFWENCVKGLRKLYHDPEHPDNPAPHPYE